MTSRLSSSRRRQIVKWSHYYILGQVHDVLPSLVFPSGLRLPRDYAGFPRLRLPRDYAGFPRLRLPRDYAGLQRLRLLRDYAGFPRLRLPRDYAGSSVHQLIIISSRGWRSREGCGSRRGGSWSRPAGGSPRPAGRRSCPEGKQN
jgi:hypothetical protein